jgi:hypothetical protein
MAITYSKVIQECLNILGAVLGGNAAAAETNYTAAPSTSTVSGPDFLASQVQDAIVAAQGEIVEAIASTPLHPGRARFGDVTTALANRAAIPRTGAGTGKLIIGVPGAVRDSGNSETLERAPLDSVRSFNRFAATVYLGSTRYWYAINAGRIEHTRTNVLIDVCVFERPTSFAGNIDLDDEYEGGLIQGAVAKLALKESLFGDLFAGANAQWQACLQRIRNYGNPDLYGEAQAAPAAV